MSSLYDPLFAAEKWLQSRIAPQPQFVNVTGGGTGGSGGGINFPDPGRIGTGYNPITVGIGGGGGGGGAAPATSTGLFGSCGLDPTCYLGQLFSNAGDLLLRIVFLLLGMICIAGAIYLFKPTQDIIVSAGKAARDGAAALAA